MQFEAAGQILAILTLKSVWIKSWYRIPTRRLAYEYPLKINMVDGFMNLS